MKTNLRPFSTCLAVLLVLSPAAPLRAAAVDKNTIDEQTINQLELRAQQANPRDQCFLYTELVSGMTDLAGKEMLNGDPDRATAMFKKIQHYAELIQLNLARDTKRLKNAEMLMHRTTYRLNEYLHSASSEDRPTLQATLNQLNKVQNDLLTQVLNH